MEGAPKRTFVVRRHPRAQERGDTSVGRPRSCKPSMVGICRHAVAVPGTLRTWCNELYRGLTCPFCLPEGGVHVVLANRSRKEELWLYLLAKLLLTPQGRALRPDGGHEDMPPPDPEGREVALVRVTP